MLENVFKQKLISRLRDEYPGCILAHLDPNETQGIPDILILFGDRWAVLEGKKCATASRRPNQQYYIDKMNDMSFGRFIYPENEEEVLYELEQALRS